MDYYRILLILNGLTALLLLLGNFFSSVLDPNTSIVLPTSSNNLPSSMFPTPSRPIYLDLDSPQWNICTRAFAAKVQTILSETNTRKVYVKCHDKSRNITHSQQLTALSKGRYVLGNITDTKMIHACYSVGTPPDISRGNMGYLLYMPLTALSLKRINMTGVVVVADSLEHWLENELFRLVLTYTCHMDVLILFIPTPPALRRQISQSSRLFVAPVLQELSKERRLCLEDINNMELMTTDSDLWTLKPDFFPKNITQNIISLNHGCCHKYNYAHSTRKMYPMAYLTMNVSLWMELVNKFSALGVNRTVTYDTILQLQIARFGAKVVTANTMGNWYMDQYILSDWLAEYMQQRGYESESVYFGRRPGERIDRSAWPKNLSHQQFDAAFDAHLPRYSNDGDITWNLLEPLIDLMYGHGSADVQWCSKYYKKFKRSFISALRDNQNM